MRAAANRDLGASELHRLRDLAADSVALAAAHVASRIDSSVRLSTKNEEDYVTSLDLETDTILVRSFGAVTPSFGIDSEESGRTGGRNRYWWIIDPLDGSQNAAFGIPLLGVSAALADGDKILAAAATEVHSALTLSGDYLSPLVMRRPSRTDSTYAVDASVTIPISEQPVRRVSLLRGTRIGSDRDIYLRALVALNMSYRRVYETRSPIYDLFLLARGGADACVCINLEGHETPAFLFLAQRLGLTYIDVSRDTFGPWRIPSRFLLCREDVGSELLAVLEW